MRLPVPQRPAEGAARRDNGADVSEPIALVAPVAPDHRARETRSLPHVALLVASLVLWGISVRDIRVGSMDDTGLVGVLPMMFFVAVGVLTASFWWLLRRGGSAPLLVLHLAGLVVVLHGLSSAIEPVPRLDAAWRHVGVTDYIGRTHSVHPPIDAYFSWPGFFALSAMVVRIAGLPDALALARWAPIFFELIYLPPLILVLSALTSDKRRVWLGCWLFYLANWIGQDYFSPQALTFFLYLAALALLLRHFRSVRSSADRPPWIDRVLSRIRVRPDRDEGAAHGSPVARMTAIALVILVSLTTVPTHQLTPFALLAAVGAVVLLGRVSARSLPILIAVVAVSWLAFMALPYVKGHLAGLVANLGDIRQSVDAGVLSRVRGSVGHLVVVRTRLALSAFVWLLAAFGAIRATRRDGAPVTTIALAVAPFSLVVTQPYGGEILLRAYLLSLPFMASLGAAALLPARDAVTAYGRFLPLSWLRAVIAGALSIGLAVALVVSKYGNENGERYTVQEVQAVDRLYRLAGPGSLLVAAVPSVPWKARHYEWSYEVLSERDEWSSITAGPPSADAIIPAITEEMRKEDATRAFVIIERAQEEYSQLLGLAPRSWIVGLEQALALSPDFKAVYRNRDAVIFQLEVPSP